MSCGASTINDPVRNPYTSPEVDDAAAIDAIGDASLNSVARTGQVITFALIQGLVCIGAILLYLTWAGNAPDSSPLWIAGLGIAAAIVSWIAAAFIPATLRRQATRQLQSTALQIDLPASDDATLAAALQRFVAAQQTATLVGQALLEGGAMINLVLMLIDHRIILHLTMVLAAIIGIAFMTPTIDRIRKSAERAGE